MMSDKVQQYYDGMAENEWGRLERHPMEYAVTMRAMAEFLPKPPATVLDIGGGPGRYSIALAQQGYRVTLLDLAPGLLDFARKKADEAGVDLADIICGNGLDLAPLPDGAFDAVLLMGPLYHLLRAEGRQQAVAEAFRVLKSGGVCFASFIGRYAAFRDVAAYEPQWLLEHAEQARAILESGVSVVPDGGGFTDAYFAHPAEIRPLMEGGGFESLALIAVEALVDQVEEKVNALTGQAWEAWVDLSYRTGVDPCLHGASSHLLWVGRRRAGGENFD
ncbi:MAG TPA: class I SAM-dependent methyltransferase [Symbiobacteriaceae bacterium]|nr:class I SAM-dependent methyltransferase [Symbiobacteriaceae bacterium]